MIPSLDLLLALAFGNLGLMLLAGRNPTAGLLSMILYALQGWVLVMLMPALAEGAASGLAFQVFGWSLSWELNGLGWFFAIITVGAAFFSAWFAAGAWGVQGTRSPWAFHVTLAANVAAMLLLLASRDLLTLFIGWELVTWAGYAMMIQSGGPATRAAYKYLIYGVAGGLAVLAAVVLIQVQAGGLGFAAVAAWMPGISTGMLWALMLLLGVGFGIKMAFLPFHRWQAEAYGESPGPAAAFLGAISSRMGLFGLLILLVHFIGLARLDELLLPLIGLDARILWMWLSALTIIIPTFIALKQNDARMLLAWHGIGQGGYMLLGVLVGSELGVAGGLLHVFNYATYQAVLFLVMGAVVYRTGTAHLDRLGGLITRMPLSYVAMLFAIIGLAGLPPMNGFVSKWMVYKALLDEGLPLLFVAAVIGTLGTILSVFKLIHNVFLGQLRVEHEQIREVPFSMWGPMIALSLIVFITGYMPGLALDLVMVAQTSLGFAALDYHLGGFVTDTGNLNMLAVVSVLLLGMGIGAGIFLLGGNKSKRVHQLDNYAGGHFLTTEVRYHYSHHFYAGLLRLIGPWYITLIKRLEGGIAALTDTLAAGSDGLYRTAYTPILMLAATVLGLALVL